MNFNEYQTEAAKTAIYLQQYDDCENWPAEKCKECLPKLVKTLRLAYTVLGILGETSEIAEKCKKIIRDNDCEITEEKKKELQLELGDGFWYNAMIHNELGLQMSFTANMNLEKLRKRQRDGKLGGSGDNR